MHNHADYAGGAIFALYGAESNASFVLRNTTVNDSSAAIGGSVAVVGNGDQPANTGDCNLPRAYRPVSSYYCINSTLGHSTATGSSAAERGRGGVVFTTDGGQWHLDGCHIHHGVASVSGGGVFVSGTVSVTARGGSTIDACDAGVAGSALFSQSAGAVDLGDVTITGSSVPCVVIGADDSQSCAAVPDEVVVQGGSGPITFTRATAIGCPVGSLLSVSGPSTELLYDAAWSQVTRQCWFLSSVLTVGCQPCPPNTHYVGNASWTDLNTTTSLGYCAANVPPQSSLWKVLVGVLVPAVVLLVAFVGWAVWLWRELHIVRLRDEVRLIPANELAFPAGSHIGRGSSGTVYRAIFARDWVCVKLVPSNTVVDVHNIAYGKATVIAYRELPVATAGGGVPV